MWLKRDEHDEPKSFKFDEMFDEMFNDFRDTAMQHYTQDMGVF